MTDNKFEDLNPVAIYEEVERDRKSGALRELIHESNPHGTYAVPKQYPDHIGKYNRKGDLVAIGHYKDGGFVASEVFIEDSFSNNTK